MKGCFGHFLLLCAAALAPSLAQVSTKAAAGTFLQPTATAQIQAAQSPAAPGAAPPALVSEAAAVSAAAPAPVAAVSAAAPAAPGDSSARPTSAREAVAAARAQSEVEWEWQTWRPSSIWSELSAFEQLIAGITFASMIKALCMIGNILVQVSPYPQVKRWETRRDTGETDAAPYVSIAFGGWQWCYYGLFAFFITKRSGFLILVHSNILGAVLGTYYNVTFLRNCQHEGMRQSFHKYLSAVASLIMLQVCGLAVMPTERALFMTGLISSFCSFVGAISMLVCVPAVIKSKDSRAIPGPLVLANAGSAIVWVVCGFMLSDPLIASPNIVAFASSSLCLYLKYIYPSSDDGHEGESMKVKLANIAQKVQELDGQAGKETSKKEAMETTPLMPATSCGTGGTF